MYLRKRSIIQLYYILIPVFFLIFMVQTPSSFAQTETLITGRVVKYSNPNEGIPNIEVTARKAQTGEPTNAAKTDANGDYTVQVDALLTSTNAEADFYVCAYDPNNIYVHECYDGYYYGAIVAFGEEELGGEVTLIHVKLNHEYPDKDFQLQKGGGNILATLKNIPNNRGYKLCLEGEINFNKKEMHKDFVIDLNDIPGPLNINNELSPFHTPLPSANYSVKIEDINLSIYHNEIFLQTTYYYQLNNYNYLLSQYYDDKYSMEEATQVNVPFGQTRDITFSSLLEGGMLYGIIKGPNMNEKISKSYKYSEVQGGKSFVSYYGATDPNTSQWTEVINIGHCLAETAIENIYLKILPQDGQQVIETLIPSKILHDPNSAYHIAASEEYEFGYGGYAFKFLNPSGDYKIQLLRRVGVTDILNVYYKDATSVTHDSGQAGIISLSSEEKVKKLDIKVPAKTNIYGAVVDPNNKLIPATVTLMTNPSGGVSQKISEIFFDPNRQETFAFEELIHGDFIVRIEMTDPEIVQEYNVEYIDVLDVQLGEDRELAPIQLVKYEPCLGNKTIQGRIFSEDNQDIGIENIVVRVININDLSRSDPCLEDITDPNGRYSIFNLPNSLYILHTAHDPNVVTEGYFNEMYKNVILFGGPDDEDDIFFPEKNEITLMKANLDPSDLDPNMPATLVGFNEGEDVTNINVGLSNHVYHFPKGLNIFSYPGTPPIRYAGTSKKIIDAFSYFLSPHLMSFVTNENNWKSTFKDPNSDNYDEPKGDDFSIKAGQGYVFYLNDAVYASLPPFTIVTPTFDMVQGLNFISLPDSFEKEYYSKNMLSDLGGEEGKACSINNYNCQTGKWKSTTCLWGLPAGDNLKFERHQGYSVYMKSSNP